MFDYSSEIAAATTEIYAVTEIIFTP